MKTLTNTINNALTNTGNNDFDFNSKVLLNSDFNKIKEGTMLEEGAIQEIGEKNIKEFKHYAVLKKLSDGDDVVVFNQILIEIYRDETHKQIYHKFSTNLVYLNKSALLDAVRISDMLFSDSNGNTIKHKGTRDIVSVKIVIPRNLQSDEQARNHAKQFLQNDGNEEYDMFCNFDSNGKAIPVIGLKHCKKGASRYNFLNSSAAGLKEYSFVAAKTGKVVKDEATNDLVIEDKDIRERILNKVFNGLFTNLTKECYTNLKAFKLLNRLAQGNAGSKQIGIVKSMIIFDNMSEKAADNEVDGTDGTSFVAAEFLAKALSKTNGVEMDVRTVLGNTQQSRPITAKQSSQAKLREDIIEDVKSLMKIGVKVNFFVYKKKRYEFNDENISIFNECLENIDYVADLNALKEIDVDYSKPIRYFVLKTASAIPGTISNSLIYKLAAHDLDATYNLVKEKAAKYFEEIQNKYSLTLEDGKLINKNISEKLVTDYSYFINYLMSSMQDSLLLAPNALMNSLETDYKNMEKAVNKFKFDIDGDYRVVLPDPCRKFGKALLLDNEVCIPGLEDGQEVSGMRYPCSSKDGITLFINRTVETLIERINKFKGGIWTKVLRRSILHDLSFNRTCAFVPAVKSLMEKHDGMDYDIDMMLFMLDPEINAIVKKFPDYRTSLANRTEDDYKLCAWEIETDGSKEDLKGTVESGSKTFKNDALANVTSFLRKNKSKIIKIDSNDTKSELTLQRLARLTANFMFSDGENVGEQTMAFENNLLALIELCKNGNESNKEKIIKYFINKYGDNDNNYVPVFDTKDNIKLIYAKEFAPTLKSLVEIKKVDGLEIKTRFLNCKKTLDNCIKFLTDVCFMARYYVETPIDATKKGYVFKAQFQHEGLIMLGSEKKAFAKSLCNVKDNEAKFEQLAEANELDDATTSQLKKYIGIGSANCKVKFFDMEIKENKREDATFIEDSIFNLRKEVMEMANLTIFAIVNNISVLTQTQEYEILINNFRNKYISSKATGTIEHVKENYNCIIGSIIAQKRDIDEMNIEPNEKEMMMDSLNRLLKTKMEELSSSARRLLVNYDSKEIGYLALSLSINNINPFKGTNSFALNVFKEEVLLALMENSKSKYAGFVGDKVILCQCFENDNKVDFKMSEVIGEKITIENGNGTIVKGNKTYRIFIKDHKVSMSNAIVEMDNNSLVIKKPIDIQIGINNSFILKLTEAYNPNKGTIASFDMLDTMMNSDKSSLVELRFAPCVAYNENKEIIKTTPRNKNRYENAVIGKFVFKNKNGETQIKEKVIAKYYAVQETNNILKDIVIAKNNFAVSINKANPKYKNAKDRALLTLNF